MDGTSTRYTPSGGAAATAARRSPGRVVAGVAAALAALLWSLPATAASRPYLVLVDAGAPLPSGAAVLQALPVAGVLLVASPVPVARGVAADTPVTPESLVVGGPADAPVDSAVASVRAPEVWSRTRGERAVVALIDTGVAPVPALEGAIAGEIDFSGTGGGDGFGHGTFLASVIAGRGPVAPGVAPAAGILSLKVGGPDGTTTLRSVMTALEWLHGPGRSAGIRVAALAMGVEAGTDAAALVDRAVDRLARSGVLVVVAAGNDGPGGLTSPATARGSLSVGADDDRGTADRADDVLAAFSGTGADADGVAQPDVTAPGVSVVGSLPATSVVAAGATPADPAHPGLYRGTGTSMATAVAAGVAALASSARPDLDGPALAAALGAGGGDVDAPSAVDAALLAPARPGASGSAGSVPGYGTGTGTGAGSPAPQSIRWTSIRWTSIRWTGTGWGDASWSMGAWGSIRWAGSHWAHTGSADPQSIRWASIRWKSIRWALVVDGSSVAAA